MEVFIGITVVLTIIGGLIVLGYYLSECPYKNSCGVANIDFVLNVFGRESVNKTCRRWGGKGCSTKESKDWDRHR